MATQIISIEVNVPPGKEISHVSEVVLLRGEPVTELIINFVDIWQWPDWLVGWIAMDADGRWNWFQEEPTIVNEAWMSPQFFTSGFPCSQLWPTLAMPSSNRDWRLSKRGRPS